MRRAVILLAAVAFAVTLLASTDAHAQCRLCKAALESGGGKGLIMGFYFSILLLLGTPFVLVGSFVGVIVYTRRKALRQEMHNTSPR